MRVPQHVITPMISKWKNPDSGSWDARNRSFILFGMRCLTKGVSTQRSW